MVQQALDNELDKGGSNVKTTGETGGKRKKCKYQQGFSRKKQTLLRNPKY